MSKKDEALKLALKKAFDLGKRYWQQANSDFTSQLRKSDVTLASFNQLVEDTIRDALAEQPAQQQVPVAWMVMNGVCNYQLFWSKHQAEALCAEMQKRHDLSGSLDSFHVQSLYAHPAPQQADRQRVPDEPDWRHPKIQALIGSDARNRICIDLVWRILEDPRREFTASDMEYWDTLHDKVQEVALAAAPEAPAQAGAVDERAVFEAWVADYALRHEPNYSKATEDDCWAAWQARAALAQKGGAA